jgi:hypothetical protein
VDSSEHHLARIADAAERIAGLLEHLVRKEAVRGSRPQLRVARAPTDVSRMEAVNLAQDGTLSAIVQNVGELETTLIEPMVQIADHMVTGVIIDRGGRPQTSLPVPAAKTGPGVIVQFKLEGQQMSYGQLPLVLHLPHRPGIFPDETILEVQMEPSGIVDSRPGWHQVEARELPGAHTSA